VRADFVLRSAEILPTSFGASDAIRTIEVYVKSFATRGFVYASSVLGKKA
jgi:hypothetical protein